MKCVVCKNGNTKAGVATLTLEKENSTIVFKGVPAEVCENCSEEYIDSETTKKLLSDANKAVEAGVQVDVRAFKAA